MSALARATATALALLTTVAVIPASARTADELMSVRPELATQLGLAARDDELLVLVTGTTTAMARRAVDAAGLRSVEVFERLAIVAAAGTPAAIRALHAMPGVRRVDANEELEAADDTAHLATGVGQLRDAASHPGLQPLRQPGGMPYDGEGIAIAVVDMGFDPAHEQFVDGGESKFDVHLRQACPVGHDVIHYYLGNDPTPDCPPVWVDAPPKDVGQSGHGTMTASVAAGYPRTTGTGTSVSGTAPAARLVGLSIGVDQLVTYNAFSAFSWILEHHEDPCGDGSCPPIRVVSASIAKSADDPDRGTTYTYDPDAPMAAVTTELVKAGLVVVLAAGNNGGDGSINRTSFLANHPEPGVLSVGGYHDGNAGDRDVGIWSLSSRGRRGDLLSYPDVLAPATWYAAACAGVGCVAPIIPEGAGYGQTGGTSVATPYVAGVVAQMLQADATLEPAQVEDILEDTAYTDVLLEAHVEPDPSNADGVTSFDGGHGLIDAVAAMSRVVQRRPLATAPAACGRATEATMTDPVGDTTIAWHTDPPVPRPEDDIIAVTTSLAANAGLLTVDLRYGDVPEPDARGRTVLEIHLDGHSVQVELVRGVAGDTNIVIPAGGADVTTQIDATTDTITWHIARTDGEPIRRASVLPYTSNGGGLGDADTVAGACSVWTPTR